MLLCASLPIRSRKIDRAISCFFRLIKFSLFCVESAVERTYECDNLESDYNKLQLRMQDYASSGRLNHASQMLFLMNNIEGKPTVYDFNSMIYCYLKSVDARADIIVGVYHSMKRFGPLPNALTFNTLINGMISLKFLKYAVFIVFEMHRCGFIPSFRILLKLLRKLLDYGDLMDSTCMFKFMLDLGYVPPLRTSNLMISRLSKGAMVQEAYFVLLKCLDKHGFVGIHSYNPILWGLCKSGETRMGLSLFFSLTKKGIVHNACSWTALLYGFGKKCMWKECFHVLDKMEMEGCKPNLITYTTLIRFLCDNGSVEDAMDVLTRMEDCGCVADIVTYNTILRELCHQNRVDEISKLIRRVDQKGYLPNSFTHAAFAGGFMKSGNFSVADRLLTDIISKGYALDISVYNIYLHNLCCNNRINQALVTLNSMVESGLRPNNITYNTILTGLCRANLLEKALELFDSFDWDGGWPDIVSFNVILSAACKRGDGSIVRMMLLRMESEGVEANVVSITCLIHYLSTIGEIMDCLVLLKRMIEYGPTPNLLFLNILLSSLCKSGLPKLSCLFHMHLRYLGYCPDVVSYNILVRACLLCGYFSEAELLKKRFHQENFGAV